MPIDEARVEKLREFGLHELPARTYVALLELGPSRVRELSRYARVPTSKIYHVLDLLQEKGLVALIPDAPKRYAPVPFRAFLERVQQDHERVARAIDRDKDALAAIFAERVRAAPDATGDFQVIRGRRNVLRAIEDLLRDSRAEFVAVGGRGTAERHEAWREAAADAAARGARLRFLLPVDASTLRAVERVARAGEVRAREGAGGALTGRACLFVADETRALLGTFVPDDANLVSGKDVAFLTDNGPMVSALRALAEAEWAHATPLETRRSALAAGREPEFTRLHRSSAERYAAAREALARGARECWHVNPLPARAPSEALRAEIEEPIRCGARLRAILNVADADAARALLDATAAAEAAARAEVRHLSPSGAARFSVLDAREGFLSLDLTEVEILRDGTASPLDRPDLSLHTSDARLVAALVEQFETLWRRATPLAARAETLGVSAAPVAAAPAATPAEAAPSSEPAR